MANKAQIVHAIFTTAVLLAGHAPHGVYSQGQVTLYQMQNSVAQASYVNPAFSPRSKLTIGLPVISSNYLALDLPLDIRSVLQYQGDSLVINSEDIAAGLGPRSRVNFEANSGLFYLGLNGKKMNITVGLNTRFDVGFKVPSSTLKLLLEGTGEDPNIGTTIPLDEFHFRAQWYNELGVGVSTKVTSDLVVGGRLRYLQGIANLTLEGLGGSIFTSIDSITLSTSPWSLQTTGLSLFDESEIDQSYFLFGNSNSGWALDVGAQYQIMDNLLVSASILDLGSISWKERTETWNFNEVNYTFEGFDFLDIIDADTDGNSQLEEELDSLESLFDPQKIENVSYTEPLTTRIYLGGTYTLFRMHTFGGVIYGEFFKQTFTPAVGLTYNIALGRILDAGISASYRNRSFSNFGAGLSAKLGPFQMYAMTDNLESLLYPSRTRSIAARFGLNLAFGKADGSWDKFQ